MMESAQDQKPINQNSSHLVCKPEEEDQDPSVSDKNHHQRLHSSSSSSSDDESDKSDKDPGSIKQSPPTQVMERSTDNTKNPDSPYKIPSYVFARTNTTAPVEWSCASNESLFSIHMGNMSFTRDYLKSGELACPRDSTFSGPFIDFTCDQPPPVVPPPSFINISGNQTMPVDASQKSVDTDRAVSATKEQEKATQNVGDVVARENEDTNSVRSPTGKDAYGSISPRSDSVKSFAFPILGDAYKSGSPCSTPQAKQRKPSQQQLQYSQPETPKIAEPQREESKREEAPNKSQILKTNSALSDRSTSSNSKWLSCFPCCATFCV